MDHGAWETAPHHVTTHKSEIKGTLCVIYLGHILDL